MSREHERIPSLICKFIPPHITCVLVPLGKTCSLKLYYALGKDLMFKMLKSRLQPSLQIVNESAFIIFSKPAAHYQDLSTWWHHELLSGSSKLVNYTGSLLAVAEVAICCGRDRSTIGCSQQRKQNHLTVYLLQLGDLLWRTTTCWGSEWSTSCCG